MAFIQSSGTAAQLVLLTPSTGGTLASPTTPTSVAAGTYNTCTAPCYTTFNLGASDTFSSPFYDYQGYTLYVGDDSGVVHQFTGVFNGNPAATGSPWPVTWARVSSPPRFTWWCRATGDRFSLVMWEGRFTA